MIGWLIISCVTLVCAFRADDAREVDYVNDQIWRRKMRDLYPEFRL